MGKSNPKKVKEWKSKKPWYSHYSNAKYRCKNGAYGKRGIKFEMTLGEFEFLWVRDNAHLLKRPSIDRINSHYGYTVSNCRFIELEENRRQGFYKQGNPGWNKGKKSPRSTKMLKDVWKSHKETVAKTKSQCADELEKKLLEKGFTYKKLDNLIKKWRK